MSIKGWQTLNTYFSDKVTFYKVINNKTDKRRIVFVSAVGMNSYPPHKYPPIFHPHIECILLPDQKAIVIHYCWLNDVFVRKNTPGYCK